MMYWLIPLPEIAFLRQRRGERNPLFENLQRLGHEHKFRPLGPQIGKPRRYEEGVRVMNSTRVSAWIVAMSTVACVLLGISPTQAGVPEGSFVEVTCPAGMVGKCIIPGYRVSWQQVSAAFGEKFKTAQKAEMLSPRGFEILHDLNPSSTGLVCRHADGTVTRYGNETDAWTTKCKPDESKDLDLIADTIVVLPIDVEPVMTESEVAAQATALKIAVKACAKETAADKHTACLTTQLQGPEPLSPDPVPSASPTPGASASAAPGSSASVVPSASASSDALAAAKVSSAKKATPEVEDNGLFITDPWSLIGLVLSLAFVTEVIIAIFEWRRQRKEKRQLNADLHTAVMKFGIPSHDLSPAALIATLVMVAESLDSQLASEQAKVLEQKGLNDSQAMTIQGLNQEILGARRVVAGPNSIPPTKRVSMAPVARVSRAPMSKPSVPPPPPMDLSDLRQTTVGVDPTIELLERIGHEVELRTEAENKLVAKTREFDEYKALNNGSIQAAALAACQTALEGVKAEFAASQALVIEWKGKCEEATRLLDASTQRVEDLQQGLNAQTELIKAIGAERLATQPFEVVQAAVTKLTKMAEGMQRNSIAPPAIVEGRIELAVDLERTLELQRARITEREKALAERERLVREEGMRHYNLFVAERTPDRKLLGQFALLRKDQLRLKSDDPKYAECIQLRDLMLDRNLQIYDDIIEHGPAAFIAIERRVAEETQPLKDRIEELEREQRTTQSLEYPLAAAEALLREEKEAHDLTKGELVRAQGEMEALQRKNSDLGVAVADQQVMIRQLSSPPGPIMTAQTLPSNGMAEHVAIVRAASSASDNGHVGSTSAAAPGAAAEGEEDSHVGSHARRPEDDEKSHVGRRIERPEEDIDAMLASFGGGAPPFDPETTHPDTPAPLRGGPFAPATDIRRPVFVDEEIADDAIDGLTPLIDHAQDKRVLRIRSTKQLDVYVALLRLPVFVDESVLRSPPYGTPQTMTQAELVIQQYPFGFPMAKLEQRIGFLSSAAASIPPQLEPSTGVRRRTGTVMGVQPTAVAANGSSKEGT